MGKQAYSCVVSSRHIGGEVEEKLSLVTKKAKVPGTFSRYRKQVALLCLPEVEEVTGQFRGTLSTDSSRQASTRVASLLPEWVELSGHVEYPSEPGSQVPMSRFPAVVNLT
jgi:hypothetical protein